MRWFITLLFMMAPVTLHAYTHEAPTKISEAQTIDTDSAKSLYDRGAIFIDVRDPWDWQRGHIEGAIHLDLNDEFLVLYISKALNKNTPIVFYCNSPLSDRSAMATYFSITWGYSNVYFYREGYYSWLAYDFPTERGPTRPVTN